MQDNEPMVAVSAAKDSSLEEAVHDGASESLSQHQSVTPDARRESQPNAALLVFLHRRDSGELGRRALLIICMDAM